MATSRRTSAAAWMAQLEALPRDVKQALAGLPPGALDTPYREGGWTARQVVHHLADSHLERLHAHQAGADRGDAGDQDLRRAALGGAAGLEQPDPAPSIAILEGVHNRLTTMLESLTPEQFARTATHPQWGPITVDFLVQMYAWHCRHHVAHIRQSAERAAFTRSAARTRPSVPGFQRSHRLNLGTLEPAVARGAVRKSAVQLAFLLGIVALSSEVPTRRKASRPLPHTDCTRPRTRDASLPRNVTTRPSPRTRARQTRTARCQRRGAARRHRELSRRPSTAADSRSSARPAKASSSKRTSSSMATISSPPCCAIAGVDERCAFWHEVWMEPVGNDRWRASFMVERSAGTNTRSKPGSISSRSWRHGLERWLKAGQDVTSELLEGAAMHSRAASPRAAREDDRRLLIEHRRRRSTPTRPSRARGRGAGSGPGRGDAASRRSAARRRGRDAAACASIASARGSAPGTKCSRGRPVPIRHGARRFAKPPRASPRSPTWASTCCTCRRFIPIGRTNRKGRGNALVAPRAIRAARGRSAAPRVATRPSNPASARSTISAWFREQAERHGLEIALDLAYQASPDHPYATDHPEWFRQRPDGTLKYAENPPKRYQDIYPFDFESRRLARAVARTAQHRAASGSSRASASSASTIRTPSRFASGSG